MKPRDLALIVAGALTLGLSTVAYARLRPKPPRRPLRLSSVLRQQRVYDAPDCELGGAWSDRREAA
jgi:hypothetical protein